MNKTILAMVLGAVAAGTPEEEGTLWSPQVPRVEGAPEFFVAPEGQPGNPGSREAPWDLASALRGEHPVPPGAVIWVGGGTYRGHFEIKLAGRPEAPIHVRAWPGERATILDSGLAVVEPANYVWVWDLEIAGSTPPEQRETQQTGSWPTDLPGTNGLTISAGQGCKFINLLIHDNVLGGVAWWVGSTDSELHGCILYNNGWRAPDRGHGHAIYVQNRDGVKTISNCIMSVPHDGSYTLHAYGSERAYVDNFVIQDNIAFEKGPFLVGGGRPSRHIRVLRNYLYGVNMQIGYTAPENEDCEVRDNVIARGTLSIQRYKHVVEAGNILETPAQKAILIPNYYDPRRAHLALYNGAQAPAVEVDVRPFLQPGDSFRLVAATDFFGKPLQEGPCPDGKLRVPMAGEFAALVLLKAD
jgi:hypothetical protein